MLTIYKVKSEDYYLKFNELSEGYKSSFLYGNLLKELNIQIDEFQKGLIEYLNSLKSYNKSNKNSVIAYDLTFSAPKSISIVALLLQDNKVFDAHENAVKSVLNYIENEMYLAREGKAGKTKTKGKVAFICIHHSLSREEDMQLHTHCLLANVILRNNKYASINSMAFKGKVKELGKIYREVLAKEIEKLGYNIKIIDKVNFYFEIDGIDEDVLNAFSQRTRKIKQEAKKQLLSNILHLKKIYSKENLDKVLKEYENYTKFTTRKRKGQIKSFEEIMENWKRKLFIETLKTPDYLQEKLNYRNKQTYGNRIDELRKHITILFTEMKNLEKKLEIEKQNVNKVIEEGKQKIAEVIQQLQLLKQQEEKVKSNITLLQSRFINLEEEINLSEQRKERLKKELKTLEEERQKIIETMQKVQSLKQQEEEIKLSVKILQNEMYSLKNTIKQLEQQKTEILQSLQKQNKELQEQNEKLKKENRQIQEQNEQLQIKMKDLIQDRNNIFRDLGMMMSLYSYTESKLRILLDEKNKLQSDIIKKKQEIEELKNTLSEIKILEEREKNIKLKEDELSRDINTVKTYIILLQTKIEEIKNLLNTANIENKLYNKIKDNTITKINRFIENNDQFFEDVEKDVKKIENKKIKRNPGIGF